MRIVLVVALLIGTATAVSAVAAPPILSKSFDDQTRGISFKYPDRFQLGRYKGEEHRPMPKGWTQLAVLVETKELRGVSVNAIPPGEIPDIELIETRGLGAQMQVAAIKRGEGAEYKKTFGSVTGYKFPGVFGPFGDQAFSYVVPIAADRVIMVIAHKYYFNDPSHSDRTPAKTNYDEVVDALLSTLAVKAK